MATTLLTWGGKTLSVSPSKIYPFDDLQFGGSVKTKDVEQSGVHKSDSDGLESASYSCSVPLDARLGVDVQSEVSSWMSLMRNVKRSNLFIGGRDIFGVPFMLTKCDAKDVRLLGNGTWLKATLDLEFTECTAASTSSSSSSSSSGGGGSSGGSGGGSSGKSGSGSKGNKSSTTHLPMTGVSAKSTAAVAAHHASGNSAYSKNNNSSGNLSGAIGAYQAVKNAVTNAAKKVASAVKSSGSSSSSSSAKKTTTAKPNYKATIKK